MDKASKALRRSSVRLKSIGTGHRDLNMVISELKDLRSTSKAFIAAQSTAAQDLVKWSSSDENVALQETFLLLSELNTLWTQVQKEFTDNLKGYIHQFEMILEGELHIDQARSRVTSCELREAKLKKELKKAMNKSAAAEVEHLESKLAEAESSKQLAQAEVLDRIQESEAVKVIRVRDGLLKLSDSYLELAHKCVIIHEAHRDISYQLPHVQDKNIHEVKCTDSQLGKEVVMRAKDMVRLYQHRETTLPCAPLQEGPPPPYSPGLVSSPYNPHYYNSASCSPDTPGCSSGSRYDHTSYNNPFDEGGRHNSYS